MSRADFRPALLIVGALLATSCAHVERRLELECPPLEVSRGPGVTLASATWLPALPELAQGNTFPTFNQNAADRRYLKLSGGTITGDVLFTSTNDPIRLLWDENILWCSDSTCGTTRGFTYASGTGRWTPTSGDWSASDYFATQSAPPMANYVAAAAGATVGYLTTSTGIPMQVTGVADASLPACGAGTAGSVHRGTTTTEFYRCDDDGTGTNRWLRIGNASTFSGYHSAPGIGAEVTIHRQRFYKRVTPIRIGISREVAGTGAGNVTVRAFDATGAAAMCTTTVACNSAGNSTVDCLAAGTSTAANGSDVDLRWDATACTTSATGVGLSLQYR